MTPAEAAAKLRHYNRWRRGNLDDLPQPDPREIGEAIDAAVEMIDRLEASEKDVTLKERVIDALGSELNAVANERDALRSLVVMRFDLDHPPQFVQGHDQHDLLEPVTAEQCRWFVAEIERLRAKVEQMERQEPAGYGVRYVEPTNGAEDWDSIWMHRVFAEDHIKDFTQACVDIGEPVGAIAVVPLYALPGAKGEEK